MNPSGSQGFAAPCRRLQHTPVFGFLCAPWWWSHHFMLRWIR